MKFCTALVVTLNWKEYFLFEERFFLSGLHLRTRGKFLNSIFNIYHRGLYRPSGRSVELEACRVRVTFSLLDC